MTNATVHERGPRGDVVQVRDPAHLGRVAMNDHFTRSVGRCDASSAIVVLNRRPADPSTASAELPCSGPTAMPLRRTWRTPYTLKLSSQIRQICSLSHASRFARGGNLVGLCLRTLVFVVRARGDRHLRADWLDSVVVAMLVDEPHHQLPRRQRHRIQRQGFLSALEAPENPAAKATFRDFVVGAAAEAMDGRYARNLTGVRTLGRNRHLCPCRRRPKMRSPADPRSRPHGSPPCQRLTPSSGKGTGSRSATEASSRLSRPPYRRTWPATSSPHAGNRRSSARTPPGRWCSYAPTRRARCWSPVACPWSCSPPLTAPAPVKPGGALPARHRAAASPLR